MKILHLISGGDTGGAKTHVLSLLNDLNKSIPADLVCYMDGDFAQEAKARGIPTHIFPDSFRSGVKNTAELIKKGGYDLVHCHGSRANLTGSILKRRFDIPFISTVHSDYKLDYLGRPGARMTYGVLNTRALHNMDYCVCVSDKMRETLIGRGFEPNKLFPIYNGVDFSVPQPKVTRQEWLREINCPFTDDDIIVGIAARLDPVKDVATTVRGFAAAAKSNERLRLVVAGAGQEMEMLVSLARDLGVSEKVFFAGWVTNMPGYYAAVDINVISSISETFPYAVTEAARAKKPTVVSRVGGLPELIKQDETGMLFEPGDHKTLGKELNRLANDPALRKRLGEAVYEKAKREFSTEGTCRRQLEIYRGILKRRKQARNGVVICGAYGHGNAGDEAILAVLIKGLRSLDRDMPITVISKSAKRTRSEHGVGAIARGRPRKILRAFEGAVLYINGGGSLIQDVTSRRSLWFYLYTLSAAKKKGCRVYMYGCGIGPLEVDRDREYVTEILNSSVDVITLRDPDSLELLRELKVTKPEICLTADPVISSEPCPASETESFMLANGMEPDGKYILLGLRSWTGFGEKAPHIAAALRNAYEKQGLTPVFLPMNYDKDLEPSKFVADMAGIPYIMLPEIQSFELAIGLLSRMELVVAMRLHTLLYASCSGTPTVGISYDPKIASFAKYIGSRCISLEDADTASLSRLIESACNIECGGEYAAALSMLRTAEHKNLSIAEKLLEG